MATNYIKEGNTVTNTIKNKDIERIIKGETEFQITDINGNIIEGKSENLLSNDFIFHMMANQLLPNFKNNGEVNDVKSQGLCNKINLINTEQEEDANLPYLKGNTVGYIDFENTEENSNSLEGLVSNSTEYKQDIVSLQGEWDLRKANGSFNTIALYGDGGFDSIGGIGFNFKKVVGFNKMIGDDLASGKIAYYKPNIFFLLEWNSNRVINYYLESKEGYLIVKKQLDLGTIIEYADNFIYMPNIDRFIATKETTAYYYKIEDNKIVLEKEKEIFNKLIITNNHDTIIATEAYLEGENNIYFLDTEFNILSVSNIDIINYINFMTTNLDGDYLFVTTSWVYNNTQLLYIIDLKTGTIISCSDNSQGIVGFYPINFNFKNCFILGDGIYNIPTFHSTQNKLPKTITKTEMTGMKVNYSFRFKEN